MTTTIYDRPISDPTANVLVTTQDLAPIGGDPPVVFRRGSAAFTSGDAIPQFRRVRGLPAFVNRAGLAGSDDMCNVGHDVTQVLQPLLSPASG